VIVHVPQRETSKASRQRINLAIVWNAQRPLKFDFEITDESAASINDAHAFSAEDSCYLLVSSIM
jgi:hypothetical protein